MKLPGKEFPLKRVDIAPMAIDTTVTPYVPLDYPADHPAHSLEFREAVSGPTLRDFVTIFFATLLGIGRVLNDTLCDQIVATYEKMQRDVDPVYKTFVAYENGKAAACCSVCLDPITQVAGIFEMGVLNDFRGKGYGQKTFNKICEYAMERNYKKMVLYATPMGRPLYQKFGFHVLEGGMFQRFNHIPE